jgi:hypothetical protein
MYIYFLPISIHVLMILIDFILMLMLLLRLTYLLSLMYFIYGN